MKHEDRWYYGDLRQDYGGGTGIVSTIGGKYVTHFVDPETVGQYTEIKDESGVEIYDRDIIDAEAEGFPFTKNWKGIVKMICGSWMIENFEGSDGEFLFDEMRLNRVIGNIHQHPNLLGGGENGEEKASMEQRNRG